MLYPFDRFVGPRVPAGLSLLVPRVLIVLGAFAAASGGLSVRANDSQLLPPSQPPEQVIDHYVDAKLAQKGFRAANLATDHEILRRTMLDLVGRIPTAVELRAYAASEDPNKRVELVDRLMAAPAFAEHQARELDILLMYGTGRSLVDYLREAVSQNRPWDEMFRETLLGQGDDSSHDPTQFIKARVGDLDKLANETSVTFFGINVSCAKCHDHPIVPEWTQAHFYGMKSFFNRTFENGDFLGEREYGVVDYKTTAGEQKRAQLMFLSGRVLEEPEAKEPTDEEKKAEKKLLDELKTKKQPPPPPQFSRRAQLVDVALHPEERHFFAKAIVNQMWNRFYGHGLVMPVDQMHPENEPSHPELLDWLARDFIEHGYDLRRLTRSMVLSRTYARSSEWPFEEDRPYDSYFGVAQVRPLSPWQYAAALRLATTSPDQFSADPHSDEFAGQVEGVVNASRGLAALFDQPVGDFQVSVEEALLLSNGERIANELLRDGGNTLLGKLKTTEDANEAVEILTWNVLNRPVSDEEKQAMVAFLEARSDRPLEARRDLLWAVLASGPMRFNY